METPIERRLEHFLQRSANGTGRSTIQEVRRPMATRPTPRPSTDEAILQERERSNQAVLRLIESWCGPGEDEEQRETLAYLKRALDEDRPSDRKRFPATGETHTAPVSRRSKSLDEILDSVRREFEESGMTEDELVRFLTEVRDEVRKERRVRKIR
jgi:hypothetical protein